MNRMAFVTVLFAAALSISACEKKGPMERAGEQLDETARTIKNGGKTTGDKVKDAAEDMSNGVKKAVDDVKK